MNKFLIRTVIFSVITYALMFVSDYIITEGLRKNKSNLFIDWNRIFNSEIKSDLIINGSSIAEVQISPQILDSVLNVNSYNFGISGYSFLMQKAKYEFFIEHNPAPKTIIQIVGDATLEKKKGLFQIEQFLPYIDDSIIRTTTSKYEGFSYYDYEIPILRYFGRTTTIIKGVSSYFNIQLLKSVKYKGYAANNFKWDNKFDLFKKANPHGKRMEITSSCLELLKNFIKENSREGINIILVFPPTYFELKNYILNRDELLEIYKSLAEENNLLFLDYSQSAISNNRDYYYNATHLNKKGSELFTKKLASDIKLLTHFIAN